MEILVHLRREMPPDDLERNTIRNRGSVVFKYHTRHDMESSVVRTREMDHPLTQGETRRVREGQSKEVIGKERFWWIRPDVIAVLVPTENQVDVFCIL
jgi:hypothetical protein